MSILFLIHLEHTCILIARRSHGNGDVVHHIGFLNRFFCLLTVYKKVYRVIDCVHVTGFIQSVSDILVRGKIRCNDKLSGQMDRMTDRVIDHVDFSFCVGECS